PLPKLYTLPQSALMAGALGYIYGKLTDVSPTFCAKLFAIAQLANSILFLLAKAYLQINDHHQDDKHRLVLACTTILTQIIGIIAMRHFNLIATKGTILWSLFTTGMLGMQLIQALDYELRSGYSLDGIF